MTPAGDDSPGSDAQRVLVWDPRGTGFVGALESALRGFAEVVRVLPGADGTACPRAVFELFVINLYPGETLCTSADHRLLELIRVGSGIADVFVIAREADVKGLVRLVEWAGAECVVHSFTTEELVFRVRCALESIEARRRSNRRIELDPAPSAASSSAECGETFAELRFREAMQQARERAARAYLTDLLRQVDGEVARAARRAGLERESLHRLLKRHEIRAGDYRAK